MKPGIQAEASMWHPLRTLDWKGGKEHPNKCCPRAHKAHGEVKEFSNKEQKKIGNTHNQLTQQYDSRRTIFPLRNLFPRNAGGQCLLKTHVREGFHLCVPTPCLVLCLKAKPTELHLQPASPAVEQFTTSTKSTLHGIPSSLATVSLPVP